MTLQHLRSSTANKRPLPGSMSDGQLAINTNTSSPGLFFKDSAGALVKVGPVHVGTTAPNASPAGGGETGNTVGEQWLDTSGSTYVFKIWDGSAWRSEAGEFVNVTGDVMTGALGIIAGSAGSPGLYFSGDTNTGIYSPGADQVAISTGGSGRLFVDASGRVGVGTSSPTNYGAGVTAISVNGSAGSIADFYFNGARQGLIGTDGSNQMVIDTASTSIPLTLKTNNITALTIDTSQRLGVGTTSPGVLLDVAGGNSIRVRASSSSISLPTGLALTTGFGISYLSSFDGSGNAVDLGGVSANFIWSADTHRFTNRPSTTEYARIDSSGRLLVGTSTSTGNGGLLQAKVTSGPVAYFEINEGGFSQNAIDIANAANFGFRPFRFFVNGIGGTEVGSISCSTTATSYVTSSDYRLKENVIPVTDGITRLQKLKPSRFNFIADPAKTVDGFIAHEAAEVVPECVTGEKDAIDADGNPVYQGIDQSKLVPLLTAALQEAVAKIKSLEARLTAAGI